MKQALRKILNGLDDVDFIELRHALSIANICRDTIKKYKIDAKQFAGELAVPENEMVEILNASYPFDLRMLSKIDAVRLKLEAEYAKQNLEEIISFPDYRYSQKPQNSEPPQKTNE